MTVAEREDDAAPMTLQSQINDLPFNDSWGAQAAALLLRAARELGCSDLQIVCQKTDALVRARREGGLILLARIPAPRRDPLLQRFKALANLPADGRRLPQEGLIEWRSAAEAPPLALRLSTLPTIHGESLLVRFPQEALRRLGLGSLGMPEDVRIALEALLSRREGAILVAGPGGSGRTTTIYALLLRLQERRGDQMSLLTVEDPVERDLGFAGQVEVNAPQGFGFDEALQSALRQEPEILMIGEIRDPRAARIAIQAGRSGRLVISCLHGSRASGVFTRLLAMGLEPADVASAMIGALAQRLAPVLCRNCRRRDPQTGAYLPEGCEACAGTGYQGRTGLYELALATEKLRELILERAEPERIAAEAARAQIGDLVREGRRLAERGVISLPELEGILPEQGTE